MLRRLLLVVTGCLLLVTLVAGTAQATTTFTVRPLGDWTSPASGNISGTAVCDGGAGTITFTTLAGTPYTVTGSVAVVCDGVSHDWAATITGGPFTQGGAIVFRATLVAPSGTVMQVPKVVLR